MKRWMIAVCLVVAAAPVCSANDFNDLVRGMEAQYGKKKVYIPFLGFGSFLTKLARPAGASDFKLAVFEDVDSARHPSPEDLDRRFRSQGWKPFVRVISKADRERVQIYARTSNREHELLIATLERHEAVFVRVRVNAERLSRWVNNPVVMARSKGHDHSD